MKKMIFSTAYLMITVFYLVGCGGSSDTGNQQTEKNKNEVPVNEFKEVTDVNESLHTLADSIVSAGGLAALGEGQSNRQDIAKDKAKNIAMGNIVESLNQKISRLTKSFIEEVGGGANTEVNETFSKVQKNIAINTLSGAVVRKTKLSKNKEGIFLAGSVVEINPKVINTSINRELKNSNAKMYERFRSSKAFDELQKETDAYDKKEQAKPDFEK